MLVASTNPSPVPQPFIVPPNFTTCAYCSLNLTAASTRHSLARLSLLVSRSSSIRKLNAKYEREEGKRRWMEQLERGRAGDKALRRAFSNGKNTPNVKLSAEPIKRSGLWRSWTLDDQMRAEIKEAAKAALHPAMMESIDEGGCGVRRCR